MTRESFIIFNIRICIGHRWSMTDEGKHKVVATARGVFDHKGGTLTSEETGVSIIIPPGALSKACKQEIYFKVCQDKSLVPPLDQDKGQCYGEHKYSRSRRF